MYAWNETELAIQDAVRQFVDTEIRPRREELEFGGTPPYDVLRKLWTTFGIDVMASDALTSLLEKERSGGERAFGSLTGGGDQAGMGVILVKELCRVSPGLVGCFGVSLGLAASTILARGTLRQKKRWLPRLVTLEEIGAWALTEPGSGSDAFGAMRTCVRRDGDEYVLNGQKTFITNGPYADTVVVYAKLDEPGVDPRERRILTFVLDAGMPGFTQGKPFRKMGFHSSPTGELFFDDVRLGRDRLLGETEDHDTGDGRDSARRGFVAERTGVAAMSLGIIEECLDVCTAYAKERVQFGHAIADYQLIQLKLAKMEIARVNVQNMVFRTLEMAKDGKQPSLAEASAIKVYSSQAATDVAMDAVQLFGGNGYMSEYPVEQLARDAKSLMIYAGSNEVQITHVARGVLGRDDEA
ncbi:acyl-CoA dehydrogenase family protein [Nocardioides antri]|uniref:Acyl-CoA dehydrogenase n=1 Tax=Nocardioides antri TaxID=2607659 RepID=A0A5B1MBM5_9ACTN|nr:acyl-CoA dehydrogenase family protein [Nocardioides antri]KAA1429419.1 acyl-CoA dehydrogenase [Nocardioides antri]